MKLLITFFLLSTVVSTTFKTNAQSGLSYSELHKHFVSPDYSYWGEVPLWWWEADSLDKERITWQLETLSAKGVKAVCPIQRSPARCYPESFSKAWWETLSYVHKECQRLGMRLWVYDQLGYGQYGWFEKAAAQIENTGTSKINFHTFDVTGDRPIQIKMPEETLFEARAYPILEDTARDAQSINIDKYIQDDSLIWNPSPGEWRIAITTLTPYRSFYMNEASTDIFLDQLYQRIADEVGEEAMGNSLIGVFQDEHPPTPRDIYTPALAIEFKEKHGYDIVRSIPALYFDVGSKTPKYRMDYLDTYLSLVEETYWKKVYNWTAERNMLTSHDNWGRNNIYNHSKGYIDYFRTQRWYSAPGLDDWQQKPLEDRNYYDTKIASSIARLYNRPRVWAEVFHTSGWGRTPYQTLTWLSTLYAFGANLYDEHGLYYSLNAGTWEHAAGDPHWRQPYWGYYQEISDWVARTSYIMSQGQSVADVAVHYPVVSLLAEIDRSDLDYNHYMKLSRIMYNAGMDNDIIDDESIVHATVQNGEIQIGQNVYQALVFGSEHTIRLEVLEKALALVQSGGAVLFYGTLPTASTENGRNDAGVAAVLKQLFDTSTLQTRSNNILEHTHKSGGFAACIAAGPEVLPSLLSEHIDRDFVGEGGQVYVSHRKIGAQDVYLIQNTEDRPIDLEARFRVDGVPELWNAFSGAIEEVHDFERNGGYTNVTLRLEGNVAQLVVLKPGDRRSGSKEIGSIGWSEKPLSKDWQFSVQPTRDNLWGDFTWPPSEKTLGPEVRQFKYREEEGTSGELLGWTRADFDDEHWEHTLYSTGPYWLALQDVPDDADIIPAILDAQQEIEAGDRHALNGLTIPWEKISFSKTIGLAKPSPWGGHSGYPDGHYDKNFIQLKEGRKLLFTRIYSPVKQQAGLNVQLRNSAMRLWVNGTEEPSLGAVGNLPLKKGYNHIVLDLPDGAGGKLFVQKDPPAISNAEGANTDPTLPTIDSASWIWVGNTEGAYFRKSFHIEELPESAKIVVTGVSGFRLFINGQKAEEDIGPWASWDYPKSVNIKPYLREGKNVLAAWGQFYKGINVSYSNEYQGFILALKAINRDGSILHLETDRSWKGHLKEFDHWESPGFNDENWDAVTLKGKAGDLPWGSGYLQNLGGSSTPYRPLSVNLSSPYIQVFDEMPGIAYDIKRASAKRVGWYRFEVPPGTKEIALYTEEAQAWVNGKKVQVHNGTVVIEDPPPDVSSVAVRLVLERGRYAGAAFEKPIELRLESGTIQAGLWSGFALPTYSGIGVYKQSLHLKPKEAEQQIELDLGEVHVAAEVFVNGQSAGAKVAAPYVFNVSQLVRPGNNEIEIRVANTLAPHYTIPKKARDLGPVESGLIGPVQLRIAK
jgi:hypothetical protein